jgi:hypothetical protein
MPTVPYSPISQSSPTLPQLGRQEISGATPQAFGAGVANSVQEMGNEFQKSVLAYQQDIEKRQNFQHERNFLEFGQLAERQLTDATREAQGSQAEGFTSQFTRGLRTQIDQQLARMSPEARARYAPRFQQLLGTVSRQAYGSEISIRDNTQMAATKSSLDSLAAQIDQNPAAREERLADGVRVIEAQSFDAATKAAQIQAWRATANSAAVMAITRTNPNGVTAALGGVTNYDRVNRSLESGNDPRAQNPDSTATGLYQFIDSTWNGIANSSAGRAAGIRPIAPGQSRTPNDPRFDPVQQEAAHNIFKQQNAAVLGREGFPVDDRNMRIMHFMGERGGVAFLRALRENPGASAANAFPEAAGSNQRVFYRRTAEGELEPRTLAEVFAIQTRGLTGAPVVADANTAAAVAGLNLEQRQQLRSQAERTATQQAAEANAAATQTYNERLNQLQTRLVDGQAGAVDIKMARDAGWLTDASTIQQLTGILTRQQNATYYNDRFNATVGGGGLLNGADSEDRKTGSAGFEAMLSRTGGNRLLAGAEVFRSSGYLPEEGAAAIRGAGNSTNIQQIQAAGILAANILGDRRQVNPLLGVPGGEEVRNLGETWRYLTDSRGMTAQQAAAEIARRNGPEFVANQKARDEEAKRMADDIRKQDYSSRILNAVAGFWRMPGSAALPRNEDARAAILKDFTEEMTQRFRETGNRGEAEAYALKRMSEMYAVSNGQVMRYPPEQRYSRSQEGSQDYIYRQAADAIKQATGHTVRPQDVTLVPLENGMTASEWRAGRPPPYALAYSYKNAEGYDTFGMVMQAGTVNQRGWRPSVTEENARLNSTAGQVIAQETERARLGYQPVKPEDAPGWVQRHGRSNEEWARDENATRAQRARIRQRHRDSIPSIPGFGPRPSEEEQARRGPAPTNSPMNPFGNPVDGN